MHGSLVPVCGGGVWTRRACREEATGINGETGKEKKERETFHKMK